MFVMYTIILIKEAGVKFFTRDTLFECTLHPVEHSVRGERNIRKIVLSETNIISGRSLYREERSIRRAVISERSIVSEKS